MLRRRTHLLDTILMLGGLGLALYYLVTETGPYRWLGELQGRWFGEHEVAVTMMALFGGGAFAAAIVASVVRRVTGIGTGAGGAERKPMAQSTQLLLMALAGAGFTVGTVLFARSVADSADRPPAEVGGVAHTELAVVIKVGTVLTEYVPITPPTWRAGQPVSIIGKHTRGTPVPVGPPWHGALLEDEVPAIARPAFEQHGVVLASPVYLLDPEPMAGGRRALLFAVVFGGIALSCFLALIIQWRRGGKPVRRVMARAAGGPGSRGAGF
jgi:hypothetical protein